jgi:hypothetical protein
MLREMVPVYEVYADRRTGKWHGDPRPCLERVDLAEWRKKQDYDATKYRTIALEDMTCALIVHITQSGRDFAETLYDF